MTTLPRPLPTTPYELRNAPKSCTSPRKVAIPELGREVLASCGRCSLCFRRRAWELTGRIQMEALAHDPADICVVNLTYADEHIPKPGSVLRPQAIAKRGSDLLTAEDVYLGYKGLDPYDVTTWLKRIRERYSRTNNGAKLRYFLCGEYGERTDRPHYHAILFGYPACTRQDGTRYGKKGDTTPNCCATCAELYTTWGKGGIQAQAPKGTDALARYVSGYVVKGMHRKDSHKLRGRHPEFARWSRKPPMGANIIPDIASVMLEYNLGESLPDVPSAIRVGSTIWPLGKSLHRMLRVQCGLPPDAPYDAWSSYADRDLAAAKAAYSLGTTPEAMGRLIADRMESKRRALGKRRVDTL